MKIAISVESAHDLTKELLLEKDIKVIPFKITLNGETFDDGKYTTEEIFEIVDKCGQLPKTTALNAYEYTEYFEEIKKEYDAIIHVCLSSGLSSSCGNAILASKDVENVFVVDSKSLSTGISLLALYARELADNGEEPQAIYEKVSKRVEKIQASFVVERLDYLYKGGRCSALSLLGANVLKIRPRLVLKDGKIISDKKYKGQMGRVIEKYCQDVLTEFDKPHLDTVFITYTTATEEMLESARKAVKNAGFKNIYETRAGGTVASHCGANTLGILYFNDGEN